ncbi:hypothetical protein VFPBJ_05373 [Purpureocillium lilacinum]|uniref:Uncharacterized protein n=1 Tax=Purpureocillium lilacinum TaxID=33203 RepID=A0A179GQL8_PURLI|nr:hypothetical protein VFPBJ_05373 [Purpureocillium lilacinum]
MLIDVRARPLVVIHSVSATASYIHCPRRGHSCGISVARPGYVSGKERIRRQRCEAAAVSFLSSRGSVFDSAGHWPIRGPVLSSSGQLHVSVASSIVYEHRVYPAGSGYVSAWIPYLGAVRRLQWTCTSCDIMRINASSTDLSAAARQPIE